MLELTAITLAQANAFVTLHHRHHGPRKAHRFSVGLLSDGELVGVAIAGNPVSKALCDGGEVVLRGKGEIPRLHAGR